MPIFRPHPRMNLVVYDKLLTYEIASYIFILVQPSILPDFKVELSVAIIMLLKMVEGFLN